MATSFVGASAVNVFAAIALKHGLKLYAATGMRPNRMYTPKNMMAAAERTTGKKFKARDYAGAVEALELWIAEAPKDGIS